MRYYFNHFVRILCAIAILVFLMQSVNAQVIDSSFYEWTVFEVQENELEDKKCYIINHPIEINSDHVSRDKPYIMIARFQHDRVEEVSIYGGFEFKLNSEVFALIDDKQYKFSAKGDFAWMDTKSGDIKVIQSILRAGEMKIRSDSSLGTYAVDRYSLKGVTRAYNRMKEICR